MERKIINPWTWQDRAGFVQGVEIHSAQRVLYCAGQTSMDSEGRPMHAGDMRAQITQALANLETVLTEAGYSLADVVRLNYYTTDVDRFIAESDVAKGRLAQAGCRPSSTLLGVTRLAYPELLIEIEATAAK
jgi:enamine deaminase RidA (YjgF/YER057c/UK114 family)